MCVCLNAILWNQISLRGVISSHLETENSQRKIYSENMADEGSTPVTAQ